MNGLLTKWNFAMLLIISKLQFVNILVRKQRFMHLVYHMFFLVHTHVCSLYSRHIRWDVSRRRGTWITKNIVLFLMHSILFYPTHALYYQYHVVFFLSYFLLVNFWWFVLKIVLQNSYIWNTGDVRRKTSYCLLILRIKPSYQT